VRTSLWGMVVVREAQTTNLKCLCVLGITMFNSLKSGNGWVGILAGALFSLLTGLIVYFITLSNKEPIYSKNSINYISDFTSTIDDLNVFYKEKKVKNLTRTKLMFINFGKSTIYQKDIALKDKLRIIVISNKINILSVKKIYEKRSVSNIEISKNSKNSNEYFINFDFLDNNDGFIVQIIHDGISDDSIKVIGTIIGSNEIRNLSILKRKSKFFEDITLNETATNDSFLKFLTGFSSGFLAILGFVLGTYLVRINDDKVEKLVNNRSNLRYLVILFFIFITLFTAIYIIFPEFNNLINSIFNKVSPPGYELFFK
jgi:hypothetical protein